MCIYLIAHVHHQFLEQAIKKNRIKKMKWYHLSLLVFKIFYFDRLNEFKPNILVFLHTIRLTLHDLWCCAFLAYKSTLKNLTSWCYTKLWKYYQAKLVHFAVSYQANIWFVCYIKILHDFKSNVFLILYVIVRCCFLSYFWIISYNLISFILSYDWYEIAIW